MENNSSYIQCKFSADELRAILCSLKYTANGTYNDPVITDILKDAIGIDGITDKQDIVNYVIGLRGNIKSLLRNN